MQDGPAQPRPMSSVRGAGYSQRGAEAGGRSGVGREVFGACQRTLPSLSAAAQGGLMDSPRRGLAKGPAPPLEAKQEDR